VFASGLRFDFENTERSKLPNTFANLLKGVTFYTSILGSKTLPHTLLNPI
jgi:hypothetical protein